MNATTENILDTLELMRCQRDKMADELAELREALIGNDDKCVNSVESKLLAMRGLANYFPKTEEGDACADLLRGDCDKLIARFRAALARGAAPEAETPKGRWDV